MYLKKGQRAQKPKCDDKSPHVNIIIIINHAQEILDQHFCFDFDSVSDGCVVTVVVRQMHKGVVVLAEVTKKLTFIIINPIQL